MSASSIEAAIASAVVAAVETVLPRLLREELTAALARVAEDPNQLVDVDEAARRLSLSTGAIRKAVERGKLPVTRIGRRLRFKVSDLIDLAQSRTR